MKGRYDNIQGTIPPTNNVDKSNRYANIQGATPIEEEKKNVETPSTNIPPTGQVAPTTKINKPAFTTDWNNFTSQIASTLPETEEKESLLFKPKQAAAVEAYKNIPEERKTEMEAATVKNMEATKPIVETEKDIVVEETPKATEIIDNIDIDDIKAATGQANPYFLGSVKAAQYENKVAASEESARQIENWIIQTTNPVTLEQYTVNDYFEWQRQYQKEIDENMPYYMDNYNDYLALMKSQHPEWSREELAEAGETYWNMFTAKEFENIESNAWNKFTESQKTSMKDASVPQKVDYLLSSITSNTVIGNFSAYSKAIIDASIDAVQGGDGDVSKFYRENMDFVKENRSKYKDLSTVQEIAETGILLAADMPVFNLLGATSGAINNYGWRAASEVATIMGVPTNIAKVSAIRSIVNIMKSSTQTGILLGAYDSLLAAGDKLSTTKISELDSEDYQDMFLNPFTKGAVAGMAVGVFSGITHGLLQKMNSNAIKKLYPTVEGKVSISTTGGTARLKLLNTGVHVGAGIIEGGLIFPLAHTAVDYVNGEEDAFKKITTQSIVEDGLKFLVAIKGQQIGNIVEQIKSSTYMVDPNFKKPFENKFNYSKMELNRWGVKDVAELKEKVKDAEWIKEAQKSGNITAVDFLKVMYDSEGLMFNNRMAIDKTVASTIDNTPVLISYDKDGKIIDIAEYKTNAEAKKAEYIMNEVNVVDNIITNSANLDSRATIELNAEYEKNPEKLVALNEAMLKSPSQRTASESQLILEVADKINKQAKRIEAEKVEAIPETAKEKEVKVETKEVATEVKETEKPTETPIEYEGKEYIVTEKDGQTTVQVKDAYGKDVPVRDTEIETKVKELYDTQDKAGLQGSERKGEKPIETKPVESTGEKEVATSGDVQTSKEKEVTEGGKTQAFAAPKESMPTLVERNNKFDVIKKQASKALKDLKKFTEEDFKTFVNDIRKAHSEVSGFLTASENKTILTQIESGVKADTKARAKSIEKIGEILEKAQDRLIESDIAAMDKSFDNFLETTKVNKQKKQVESKTTKGFTDFTKKVKEISLQEPSVIETKLEDNYDKIITGTEAESTAAKAEVEALIYAQDYSTFNQNKQIFENPASTRTEKMIAYYEMMDIYDKFLSKNPVESYRKAVDEKMKILEKEKAVVQKKIEIMQNPDLRVEDIPKTKELFDITDNLRISTEGKKAALAEFSESVNNSKTLSPKDKAKLNKAIDKLRMNPLIISKNAIADNLLKSVGLTKQQKDITREKPKTFKNPLRRMLNRFDNLQQMGKVLGWKNREIRDYFAKITDIADNSAIKADKMTNEHLQDIAKLEKMIYGNSGVLANWTQRSDKLGVQETLVDAEGKPFTDFNKLSYNDIVYIDRLLKTPQNKEIVSKIYGEESIDILQKHCEKIIKENPKLKEISDYVFNDLQNKIYDINNEQYVKENNVDLPKFDDYVARFAVKTEKVMGKTDVKGSLKPSATRVRTVARQLKTDVNIVEMIDKAYTDAIKYNAFSDLNTEMRRVLMNDKVKSAILTKVAEGDTVWKNLNRLYEAYPEGVKINETIVPKIISNAVIAKLRMNPTMILKQASSASNSYADYIKIVDNQKRNLVPGLVEAMYAKALLPDKYTGEFLKSAINNKALKTRLQNYGIDPHLADYMQKTLIEVGLDKAGITKNANTIRFFRQLERFKDMQGLPVKYGDIAAFWGAKPLFNIYYKKALSEGMTKEQAGEYAIDNAYKSWAKTNQSIWSHNMSAFQLSPVGKLFAYYTSPIQMGQQTRGAIRDILAPSSTPNERVNGAKTLAYYAAFQKTIFMLAGAASTGMVKYLTKSLGQALGYDTNPDDSFDDLSKVLDIPEENMDVISKIMEYQSATQGIPVIDELTSIVADAMKDGRYSDKDIISTVGMIEKIGNNVGKITDILSKKGLEGWTDKEKREVIRFTSQIGDMLTGYGISPSNRILEYLTGKDILNDTENSKKEETSTFGTGTGYTNETEEYSTKGGFINQTEEYSNDSE